MDMMKTGVFLQNLRKEKNFTQQELADYFHVSSKTVSKWECGKALPELPLLKEISEFYSVSIDEILNGEKNAEVTMGNHLRKEEMQSAYKKKKNMWVIFCYVSFFILVLGYILLPIVSSIKASLARPLSLLVLVLGLFVYFLGFILSKLDKEVHSKSVYMEYQSQRINASIWFVALWMANIMIVSWADDSFIKWVMNVQQSLDGMALNTLVFIPFFGILGLICQLIKSYVYKETREKTKHTLAFVQKHHFFFYAIFLFSTLSIFLLPWATLNGELLSLLEINNYTFLQIYPTTFYIAMGLYAASLILVVALYKFPQVHVVSILMLIATYALLNQATLTMINQEYNAEGLALAFNSPRGANMMMIILSICFLVSLAYSLITMLQNKKVKK